MSYQDQYRQKLVSAATAAAVVKSGDWVDYAWTATTPRAVDRELAKRLPDLYDVNFYGGILLREPEIFKIEDPAAHMTWNSWHMAGFERKAIAKGFSFYCHLKYSELPRYYFENVKSVDVAIMQVGPMDDKGYFNLGPSASHAYAAIGVAKKVIVEVNESMPICLGDRSAYIHIDQVDMIVETDNEPIYTLPPAAPGTEVDQAVAKLVVERIPDGACLQLGIGGMPNAIGKMIAESDLKDLGIHTEMYVDAFVDMAEAGRITGAKKNFDRGLQTFAPQAQRRCTTISTITPRSSPLPSTMSTTMTESPGSINLFPSTMRSISTFTGRSMRRAQAQDRFPVPAVSLTLSSALTAPTAARPSSACPPPSRTRTAALQAASVPPLLPEAS